MSIFHIAQTGELLENMRTEQEWVELGVEYLNTKKTRGVSVEAFARQYKIDPRIFRTALKEYNSKIRSQQSRSIAEAKKDPEKPEISKPEKKKSKRDIISDFRALVKRHGRNEGAAVNNKSMKWFQSTLSTAVRGHKVSKPRPGRLFAFIYDAKHRDTLPHWDRFPLIIYLGEKKTKNGILFMGLNLHYIPPKARQAFLEQLLPHANTDTITNKTTLKINWGKVRNMRGADHMIKTYIPSRVKGTFTEIKPHDWPKVIHLPLQQFLSNGKRYSARKVWAGY